MAIDFSELNYISNPSQSTLKADYIQFLLSLSGPTVIDITSPKARDWYVVTTLLHGNEPSGFIAMHEWLSQNEEPLPVNLRFIICSVEAATQYPVFTTRYVDGGMDINRCFGSDSTKDYYLRANNIEKAIRDVSPALIVDMHNTSGSSPAFSVSARLSKPHLKLASFFCDHVILSHITLGALMEIEIDCPVITLECGGSSDAQANSVAFDAISTLSEGVDLTSPHRQPIKIIHHPMRLQLNGETNLSYCNTDSGNDGVTLISNIEQFNYGKCPAGQIVGWLDEYGLNNLVLLDEDDNNVVNDFFYLEDNKLISACDFQIFMATRQKRIAKSDCLFYITA